MAQEIEFDPTDTIAVGAVGPPGRRVFYLQARTNFKTLTLTVEKAQVQLLAERTLELLEGKDPPAEDAAALAEPLLADWRAGPLGFGVDPDRDRMVLVAEQQPESEDASGEDLASARFWVRPAQMAALARRGLELVTAGRPLCALCGLPMDPEGHVCPRKNGKSPVF
jgi:uncharacterized repeat protein (TIGR03847 family)